MKVASVVALVALATPSGVRANAPATRYAVSNGTVADKKTKLTWQQTVPTTTYNWSDANTYCQSTVGAALGGTGWRLPSIKELQTLFESFETPNIDPTAFPNTQAADFWSSTVWSSSATAAALPATSALTSYYIYFAFFGVTGSGDEPQPTSDTNDPTQTFYVRCVR